ncbi:MAG: hypothetical protein PHW03_02360 [Eubacteriales bacterium]|nr:hypothetical protein [Eubacteriales bacterium]MDD4389626.1 hypothetical protein [Eubacteriales bacterium]
MNKKGAAIVEGAIIYPLIILSIITALYILIGLYNEAASVSELHTVLRQSSGNESETVKAENFKEGGVELNNKMGIFYDSIQGSIKEEVKAGGLIKVILKKDYCDEITIIDEEKYIRWSDAASGIIKKEV